MGQRGNYIIKEKGKTKIYYTHWRAINIAQDLFLGSSEFMNFINQFEEREELTNYPWIEGYVIVDKDKKELLFSESEYLDHSTVRKEYVKQIKNIWGDWKITYSKDGLYSLANEVDSDYINKQEKDFEEIEINSIKNETGENINLAILYKNKSGDVKLIYLNSIIDGLLLLGSNLLETLNTLESQKVLSEVEFDYGDLIYIDEEKKKLLFNDGIPRLLEELKDLWNGWSIEINEAGYLEYLSWSGMNTDELEMSKEKVNEILNEIKNTKDNFDPNKFAEKMLKEDDNVEFHPNFFENIKPNKTVNQSWIDRIMKKIKRAWNNG